MTRQEPLALYLEPSMGFHNLVRGDNSELIDTIYPLAQAHTPGFIALWGPPASGKSHLLQALCNRASEQGQTALYLPLQQILDGDPEALDAMASTAMICLDDLDAVIGRRPWQEALYRLYNGVQQASGCLVSASRTPPRELPLELPDLKSRLSWGPCYQVLQLGDEHKGQVLKQQAKERGLQLPDEAVNYLLNHQQRDLASLIGILDRLDRASLAAQRRLTVPFIREQLR